MPEIAAAPAAPEECIETKKEPPPKKPPPVMRNLLEAQIKTNLSRAFGAMFVVGLLFKIFYMDPKKKAYKNFYAHLDCEAEYNRLRNLGYMQSDKPDEDNEEEE